MPDLLTIDPNSSPTSRGDVGEDLVLAHLHGLGLEAIRSNMRRHDAILQLLEVGLFRVQSKLRWHPNGNLYNFGVTRAQRFERSPGRSQTPIGYEAKSFDILALVAFSHQRVALIPAQRALRVCAANNNRIKMLVPGRQSRAVPDFDWDQCTLDLGHCRGAGRARRQLARSLYRRHRLLDWADA